MVRIAADDSRHTIGTDRTQSPETTKPATRAGPPEPLWQFGGLELFRQIPHLIQPIGKGAVREAGG
jgi:hypothetical protein